MTTLLTVFSCLIFAVILQIIACQRAPTWDACNCHWVAWQEWSKCSKLCYGRQRRERKVSVLDRCTAGFRACDGGDGAYDNRGCNEHCNYGTFDSSYGGCRCPRGRYGPCCVSVVTCGSLTMPANGDVNLSKGNNFGSVATFSCYSDYNLTGTASMKCVDSYLSGGSYGIWTGLRPKCLFAQSCKSGPCQNGGTCVNRLESYTCKCNPGWSGVNCEADVQPPVVTGCDKNRTVHTSTHEVSSNWTKPSFSDPLGHDVMTTSNYHTNKFTFPWGDYVVQYIGTKPSNGLRKECKFQLQVRPFPCKDLPAPLYGYVACNGWRSDYGRYCLLGCLSGYSLANDVDAKQWYVCGATGTWSAKTDGIECEDTDDCLSSPCLHGSCADQLGGYTCTCGEEFRGLKCEINIDDCENNACANNGTCVDDIRSYKCSCPPNYTGQFCDDNIDCSSLTTPSHAVFECRDESAMKRCSLTCEEDYDLDRPALSLYECGIETGYEWSFKTEDNPYERLPNCLEKKMANEYNVTYRNQYLDVACSSDNRDRIISHVHTIVDNLSCIQDRTCEKKSVTIQDCKTEDASRRKRATINLDFSITLASKPPKVGAQSALTGLNAAVIHLNSSAGSFTVSIHGSNYVVSGSPSFSANAACAVGTTRVEFYCIPCGPGTFYINGYCERCDIGRFNNKTRMQYCTSCPMGMTTDGRGAVSQEECNVPMFQNNKTEDNTNILLIVLIPVGCFLLVFVFAVVIFAKWKNHKNKITVSTHSEEESPGTSFSQGWFSKGLWVGLTDCNPTPPDVFALTSRKDSGGNLQGKATINNST